MKKVQRIYLFSEKYSIIDLRKDGKLMNITDIWIRPIAKEGKMKAIASVTFDAEFVVHDMKVIEGSNGLFLAMPSRRTATGSFRDIAHPINANARKCLEEAILKKYHEVLQEAKENPQEEGLQVEEENSQEKNF